MGHQLVAPLVQLDKKLIELLSHVHGRICQPVGKEFNQVCGDPGVMVSSSRLLQIGQELGSEVVVHRDGAERGARSQGSQPAIPHLSIGSMSARLPVAMVALVMPNPFK
jgi:hypothetical protein